MLHIDIDMNILHSIFQLYLHGITYNNVTPLIPSFFPI